MSTEPNSDSNSETLRTTEVDTSKRIPPSSKPKGSWTPAKLFADYAFAARAWALVAVAALAFTVIQPFLIIEAYRTRERVIILDGGGSFTISPLLGFEEAKSLHETMAVWATLALLQRNPRNFDFPDLLQRIYLTEACTKAQDDLLKSREEAEVKQLHQKPEIFKIEILRTREDQVLVKLEGQLIRTGVFDRQAFTESPRFNLSLTLVRNPDMASNKRYPLAVWNYDFSIL